MTPAAKAMTNHRSRQLLLFVFLTVTAVAECQAPQAKWVVLSQDVPKQALTTAPIGPKPATDILHISMAMPYADPVGMQKFVDSVSNPQSPDYRKFLTPDQVGSRFGLPASSVKKVSDYLASQGMKIRLVGKNRLSILADATVAQAESAFHVSIREFSATLAGVSSLSIPFSSTTPPSVPASIGSYVQYIGGLENFTRPTPAQPLVPDQLRTLYSVTPLYNEAYFGQGRTVAVSNWTTYGLFNIPLEYVQWNLPTPAKGIGSNVTVVSIDGANGEVSSGAEVECDIDIQTVLAMAPLCHLILYDNANNSDILGVLTQEADDNSADLITESYAWNGPAPLFVAAHDLHLSMSAQGITYVCASGDWGAQGMANLYYPDEDPEVCSVGGTSVTTDAAGNRISEVVWNGSSGGGWVPNSDPFNMLPTYQKGNGVPTNVPFRLVPDVALDADPGTGYEVFIDGGLQAGWGGTSCASPTFAGALAASEQAIIANGGLPPDSNGYQRLGRIQDLIYSINGDPSVFYDITSGNNGTLPNGSASNATVGWDTATGWGTMIFSGFVARVLSYPPVTSVTLSSSTLTGGSSTTGTVTFASPVEASTATLNMSSNGAGVIVPATITVSKGATSATFTVHTIAVSASSAVTISAALAGSTKSAILTVVPATLGNLFLSPSSVVGGNSSTGSIILNGPAGPGGTTVNLSSSGSGATVPASVTVAAGASSATFTVTTFGESSSVSSTIVATLGGASQNSTLTITPATLTSVTANPTSVVGSNPVTVTVKLSGLAPPGGTTILLSAVDATVPENVVVPGGSSSTTFSVTTKTVAAPETATVTAKFGQTTQSGSFTIQPATLATLTLSPTSVVGGSSASVSGTITFTGPAPSAGDKVTLASSNAKLVTVPTTVTLKSGSESVTFALTHKPVAGTQTVTITASFGSTSKQAVLTLQPAELSSISVSPNSVKGSSTTAVTGTLTLSGPASASGIVVTLSSSMTSAATVPASVAIPAGKSSATFKVAHKKVLATTPVTLTGSSGQTAVTTTLTVTP